MNDRDYLGVLLFKAETLAFALEPLHGQEVFQGPYGALREVTGKEVFLGVPQGEKEGVRVFLDPLVPSFVVYDPALDPFVALLREIPQNQKGPLVILSGTLPFLGAQTLKGLIKRHSERGTWASVLTVMGSQEGEAADVRFGGLILDDFPLPPYASSLNGLLSVWNGEGKRIEYVKLKPPDGMDVANAEEFLMAFEQATLRRVESLIRNGVILEDPKALLIDATVVIQRGVRLGRGVILQGRTRVEEGVQIGPYCVLKDVILHPGAKVLSHSILEGCEVGEGARIGPFSRIRPETVLGKGVSVGNFVELKKAYLEEGVKANHLSYLGDCEVGAFSNIGAGVITCNFDGVQKHPTKVGQGVFIGSDSQLVAPVEVGPHAYIGAGSTITRNVPPKALAVRRAKMKLIANWAGPKKKT